MDTTQERICLILERLTGSTVHTAAMNALSRFRVAGLRIAALPGSALTKRILLARLRDKLHAELCDLVAPLGLGKLAGDVDEHALHDHPTVSECDLPEPL